MFDGVANYPNPSRPVGTVVDGFDVAGVNYVARTLGLANLRWSCSVSQGTVVGALVEAANAVVSGAASCVLVWRGMFNPPGRFGRVRAAQADGPNQFTHPYGLTHNVLVFALPLSRYLARSGRSRADLAPFIIQNRTYVVDDPASVFAGEPLTVEDYLDEPLVGAPLSKLDCDMPVTGCGAFVVCSAERARDLRQRPAYITGRASLGLPVGNSMIMRYEDLAASGRQLGSALWDSCGLRPADVQQANLYDGFSFYSPMWAEWLGFAAEGEGIDYVSANVKTRIPLNTSGGALGRGRLHGTPQVIEAVHQLQGRSRHQVPDARVTLAQAGDPSHGAAAVVLTSE